MPVLIARRFVAAIVVLAALSVLIFIATDVLPGDAAGILAGTEATQGDREALQTGLGLDRPAPVRYLDWAGAAIRGDLGTGYVGGRDVSAVLGDALPNSLVLTGLALGVAVPVAIALGLLAAARSGGRSDRTVSAATLLAASLPEFVTAALFIWAFGVVLDVLPEVSIVGIGARPWETPEVMVLPATTLAVVATATASRLLRAAALDVGSTPYVQAARLRGVAGVRLAVRHVLPPSLAPTVQVVAVLFSGLIGGAVVIETIFSYPGIGFELAQAVGNRDVPMVQGLSLALCAIALLALLAGDIVATLIDPRSRRRG
ncbi:binding-protein-dependent transport systems inner membrane component [Candidatus Protofrankia californiensis]|uniref:Binding-protein-dependent transport systems inner membrane component n=1 Tax=Candidatus Protofrankia californiensis TaxID=1839754 RepID=A0A1C3PG60_9ACTN|nr:binding-protein-dependent transport systems inner membrane component [Candidatus Protofrankia californiensis]